jgi:uncharacterized membrane-anchored protein
MPAGDDPRQHPWWQHLPAEGRRQALRQRRRHRLWQALSSRRGLLLLLLLLLLAAIAALAAGGAGGMGLALLLPLALLPALAGFSYWLTWREFHR